MVLDLNPSLFLAGDDPSGDPSCALVNPERGFYRTVDLRTVDAGTLSSLRDDGHSLVYGRILIPEYRTAPLDQALLDQLDAGFDAVEASGMEVIPRVYYTDNLSDPDAPLDWLLMHVEQLAPTFSAHASVIAVLQAGLIGAWGEWHGSQNGLDDDAARAQILEALLAALPASRMVQVRRPSFKENAFGGPLDASTAHNGSDLARLGHHNDCFLASADDFGTYGSPQERAYMEADAPYVPVGGETCAVNPPRSECSSALDEMALLHFSYLNAEYHPEVLDGWQQGGCYARIACQMGYRLAVTRIEWQGEISGGGEFSVRITLVNDGFAAPYNQRQVRLVLSGPEIRVIDVDADPRTWQPGEEVTLCVATVLPPDLLPGLYTLGLWLPHTDPSLEDRPDYAIRLAESTWESATGHNLLPAQVAVLGP